MARLAEALSNQLERVVTDDNGLGGKYDLTVTWTPDRTEMGGRGRAASANAQGAVPEASTPETDLFAARAQQLGLKLVSKKVTREAVVIDRAERTPTDN